MKKCWTVLGIGALLFLSSSPLPADVLTLGKCQVKHFNDVYQKMGYFDFEVQYDTKDSTIGLFFHHALLPCEIWMNAGQRDQLSTLFAKYHEWDKLEAQKGVEIDKEMGKFRGRPYFEYGDWHTTGGDEEFGATFFTRTVGNNEMVLTFDEWTAGSNEYITHKEDPVYIEKDEIPLIEEWISDAYIQKALSQEKQKQDQEKDFK